MSKPAQHAQRRSFAKLHGSLLGLLTLLLVPNPPVLGQAQPKDAATHTATKPTAQQTPSEKPTARQTLSGLAPSALPQPLPTEHLPVSYSSWYLKSDGAEVEVQIHTADLNQLQRAGQPQLAVPNAHENQSTLVQSQGPQLAQLPALLQLKTATGRPCQAGPEVEALPARSPWVVGRFTLHCPTVDPRELAIASLGPLLQKGHQHLARISPAAGAPFDVMLDQDLRKVHLTRIQSTGSVGLLAYGRLGAEHALTHFQHLALLAGLFLLSRSGAQLLRLLMAFAGAYGLTLVAGALSWVHYDARHIGALLAIGIALPGAAHVFLRTGAKAIPGGLALGVAVVAVATGSLPIIAVLGLLAFTLCHFALLAQAPHNLPPGPLSMASAVGFGALYGLQLADSFRTLGLAQAPLERALLGYQLGLFLASLLLAVLFAALRAPLARLHHGKTAALLQEATAAILCGLGIFWYVSGSLS